MLPRIAAAVVVPALAAAAALGAVVAVGDAQQEAVEEARAAQRASAAAHELERAAAGLERGALAFVVTGRESSLAPYRAARQVAGAADPRIEAYASRELDPLIALARRDRREARIAVARGDVRREGARLRGEIHALADARAAAADAAAAQALARGDDERIVAIAGAGAVLLLAVLSAALLARSVRRRLRAGDAAARRLAAQSAVGAAVADAAGPDMLLREIADALDAEIGALYARAGDGPMRLVAVRGIEGRRLGDELRPGEGLAGRAVAELRPVAAAYGDAALTVRAHGADVPVRHELHVPLRYAHTAVGAVTLARLRDAAFSSDDVELAGQLAPQAAAALGGGEPEATAPPARDVDLVRLTRESVEAARPDAEARGVDVLLELESVPRCEGDPDRISLALDEVVGHAMAAANPGGRVHVRLFPRGDEAVIELALEPGAVQTLELTRSVVESHGGVVRVEGPGAGRTAFRVELPLRTLDLPPIKRP